MQQWWHLFFLSELDAVFTFGRRRCLALHLTGFGRSSGDAWLTSCRGKTDGLLDCDRGLLKHLPSFRLDKSTEFEKCSTQHARLVRRLLQQKENERINVIVYFYDIKKKK